jgi:hypothetical protein
MFFCSSPSPLFNHKNWFFGPVEDPAVRGASFNGIAGKDHGRFQVLAFFAFC